MSRGQPDTQLGAQRRDWGWDKPETPQQVSKWRLWSHFLCESSHDNYLEMKRTSQVGSPCCGGGQPSSWAESWAECSRPGAARSAEVGREVVNWLLCEIG